MEKKYIIDTSENRAFMSEIRDTLLQFGRQFPSPEGASYYLGDDGTPWKEWITCRMAHVYSIGTLLGHEGSQQLVDAALKGLTGILKDEQNGGWYAGITPEGSIVQGKQCYAHAFVILASTSALLAGRDGASELLEKALKTFDQYFWDAKNSLTFDTWNTELTVLDDYRGINANMHTVEAFLAVADATGNQEYRERAGRIIDHVIGWAADNQDRIPEHFTKNWEADLECNQDKPDDPFKPYGATPGHGIEWARLSGHAQPTVQKTTENILKWPNGYTAGPSMTHGMQTARRASSILRIGTENQSCMTVCTGRWQRPLTLPPYYTESPKSRNMRMITPCSCNIWTKPFWIMKRAPGSINWMSTIS